MKRLVIGLGFRDQAPAHSIDEVLARAVRKAAMPNVATVLAVVEDKAAHPSLVAVMRGLQFPIETVTADAMREADSRIATRSDRVIRQRGVGSVCEATALAATGVFARLVVTRIVSTDRTATAAAALTEEPAP
jgi:cobalt-precorrin 5A hydrolase